jgi:membrane protein implicated in regulation of membrane protease activity
MPDLTEYSWIAWVAIVLICVIIELLTLEFTFLMVAAGAVGGLGADLLGAEWWVQILVALALSVLLILTIRPLLLRLLHRGADPTPSNIEALLGMAGRVAMPLDDIGGQVRLANGETWTARLDEAPEAPLPLGAVVTVRRILGSVVIVEPAAVPPTPSAGIDLGETRQARPAEGTPADGAGRSLET